MEVVGGKGWQEVADEEEEPARPSSSEHAATIAVCVRAAGAARDCGEAVPRSQVARFLSDDPSQLYLGEQRLDKYLQERGLGWVVRVREVLQSLDYEELCAGYSGRGRRAYHPRTLVSLIVYGFLLGHGSLRALEGLARRDVGAWWLCGGSSRTTARLEISSRVTVRL